jgi:hypothetical protein
VFDAWDTALEALLEVGAVVAGVHDTNEEIKNREIRVREIIFFINDLL